MKVKKNDKIVLVSVKNVYGVDYQCIYGTLLGVRELYGYKVYKVKAKRMDLLVGGTDMGGKEMEVSSQVFHLRLWNAATKSQLKTLRTAALDLHTAWSVFTPKTQGNKAKTP